MTQSSLPVPSGSTPTVPLPRRHVAAPLSGAAALALGLVVGALTSYGQTLLGGTALAPLTNSVSAWLVVPFVVGAWMRSPASAAAAGLGACALQVVGYDLTAELRGFSSPLFWTLFWVAGATLGGPLLGYAGHAWHRATRRQGTDPAGAMPAGPVAQSWGGGAGVVLPAAFISEGLIAYGLRLGYGDQAAVFVIGGIALAWQLTRARPADLRWLAVAVPCGMLGQLALGALLSGPFTG